MYKSLVWVSLLFWAVVIGSGSASAQIFIQLGPSSQSVTFTKSGSNINLQLGTCVVNTCTLNSSDGGNGLFVNGIQSGVNGSYTFTTNIAGGTPVLSGGPGSYTYNASGSSTTFTLSGIDGMAHALMLTLNFTTVDSGNSTLPTFHGSYIVTSDTDALLGQFFLVNNVGDFRFIVSTSATLDSLTGSQSTSGPLTAGTILNPEPASVALFGSGLLMLSRVLRRRKTPAPRKLSED